jgi:hypothetical protein
MGGGVCACGGDAGRVDRAQERPAQQFPIHRADDLPRHPYPIETTVAALLEDARAYAALAARIEANLRGWAARRGCSGSSAQAPNRKMAANVQAGFARSMIDLLRRNATKVLLHAAVAEPLSALATAKRRCSFVAVADRYGH